MSSRPLGTGTKMVLSDVLWVLLAALVLALILFPLARFWRRRSKRREHRSHRPAIVQNSIRSAGSDSVAGADDDDDGETEEDAEGREDGAGSSSGRHRKRRRRRGHRPRNPTLEETGGLPPSRAGDSTAPRS